ncbi:hypothetical protein TWF102_009346 [Orbilia oligospora]|uniref:HhH-GPD domain-containing protein n=1 Tax=Orbilia oligospora TaxID=2813651 RepID=A0A7C8J6N2_ORBOL|nr:hypothetical protein TWF103_004259 [Orbilia oligospora]KAF3090388.1 hypothetical protein TWF102_009346 [Orbilia oligospora]
MDLTEQAMEGSTGRGRRASSRIQKLVEEPVVPGTQEESDIPSEVAEEASIVEDALDEPSEPKAVLPSEDSSMETSPYFAESTPQTSTRRLRPRTFRSPIKVPPLLLSKRVTRSASTTTPRARKQGEMATTNEETPQKSKSDKSSKTPKTASSKKQPKENPEKSPKDAPKPSSKTPAKTPAKVLAKAAAKTPSKTLAKTPAKTPAKTTEPTSSENPIKSSTRKSNASTATGSESDLILKYGENFDWEEYAKFCMRRTRLPTDPSVTSVIENIKLYGNWKGENQKSSGKASGASKKKQSVAESSTAAASEPKEEKKRTKEERKVERELKKQRREERRRRKEEKKSKKEREGETKKKHKHKKKSQEEEEDKDAGTDASSEGATPREQQSSSSPEASGNTSADSAQPTKSRKRKSDDSETSKPKKARKADPEAADAESTAAVEEPKSTTKQRKSPAKQDIPSTALETVSESVLNLGSSSPSKRVPAGTSVIVPPPVDAVSFGLIQEEVCHNPYYLLIATVFLQKTKGSSAIPVFREFLRRWPTPQDLLASSMDQVKKLFHPLGLHTVRAKTVWMMAHHFHLLDPYKKPRGPQSWKVRADYKPQDPTGLNRKWGCIIGDVYGCGTYVIDSWRIFCMKPGEGGFIDGTTVGKPQKRKTVYDDTLALPVAAYPSDFNPGDEEWRKISPDREVLDKELQAYIRWMHAKDAAGFGTVIHNP